MPQIIITAEVEDLAKWEEGFRTHADLFRRQTCTGSVGICMQEGNKVAVTFNATDLDTFLHILETEGPQAMANDGVRKETMNMFIVDKEMKL